MNGEKARDETKDQSKEKADQAGPPREAPKDMIRRTLLGSGGDQQRGPLPAGVGGPKDPGPMDWECRRCGTQFAGVPIEDRRATATFVDRSKVGRPAGCPNFNCANYPRAQTMEWAKRLSTV